MPVTFETDLKDLRPQTYTQQLPLDEMFRGLGYKQAEYDQGVQQAKAITQSAANILRGYGQDQEMADQLKGQLNEQLKKFSTMNYDDTHAVNQLNSYVSSFLNNPHVVGLAARTNKYEQDQKLMKDYQEKGKEVPTFLQPSLVAANKYYNSGKYDPTTRFVGQITTAPDMEKIHKSITEKLTPDIDEHGNEYVSPERYTKAFKAEVDVNPALKSYFDALHDANNSGTNWDEAASKGLNSAYISYSQQADAHRARANGAPDARTRSIELAAADQAQRLADMSHKQLSNPNKAEAYRATSKQNFVDQIAQERGEAFSYNKQAHWMDQELRKHQYRLDEIGAENANRLEIAKLKASAKLPTEMNPQSTLQEYHDLTKDEKSLDKNLVVHDGGGQIKKFSLTEIGDENDLNEHNYFSKDKLQTSGNSKDWLQYTGEMNPIHTFAGSVNSKFSGESGDQLSMSVTPANIATDSQGRRLQFINSKTHQIAYVGTDANGAKQWNVVDYPSLVSKLKANAKKFQLQAFTYPNTYDELDQQISGSPVAKPAATGTPASSGGSHPLPAGKARTVKQNNVTYTWNDQTGKYE